MYMQWCAVNRLSQLGLVFHALQHVEGVLSPILSRKEQTPKSDNQAVLSPRDKDKISHKSPSNAKVKKKRKENQIRCSGSKHPQLGMPHLSHIRWTLIGKSKNTQAIWQKDQSSLMSYMTCSGQQGHDDNHKMSWKKIPTIIMWACLRIMNKLWNIHSTSRQRWYIAAQMWKIDNCKIKIIMFVI